MEGEKEQSRNEHFNRYVEQATDKAPTVAAFEGELKSWKFVLFCIILMVVIFIS